MMTSSRTLPSLVGLISVKPAHPAPPPVSAALPQADQMGQSVVSQSSISSLLLDVKNMVRSAPQVLDWSQEVSMSTVSLPQ